MACNNNNNNNNNDDNDNDRNNKLEQQRRSAAQKKSCDDSINNNNNNNNKLAVKDNNRRNSTGSSGARMWLRIAKKNIVEFARKFRGSASLTQKENGRNRRPDSAGSEANRNDANDDKTRRPVPPGGPLVQQTEVSTSQLDFFRMLDEKIENGPDFDENDDSYSILNQLKSPRAKSLASSTHSSLPQPEAATTTSTSTSSSSSTAVAGSGGAKRRPSSTPITIKRSHDADKIDGISSDQRHHHHNQGGGNGAAKIQAANLPKHMLEPIAQSPKSYTSTRTSPPEQDEAQSSSSSNNKRSSTATARTSPQQQQSSSRSGSSSSSGGGCDFGVKIRGRPRGAECVKESRLVPESDRPVPMVYPYRPDQDSRTYERIHGTGNSCDFAVRIRGRATGAEALEQAVELQRKRNSSASSSSSLSASSSSSSRSSRSSRSSAVSSYQPEPPENPLVAAFDENTLAMQRDAERRRQRHRNHKL